MPPSDKYGKEFSKLIDSKLVSYVENEVKQIAKEANKLPKKRAFIVQKKTELLRNIERETLKLFNEATNGSYKEAVKESRELYKGVDTKFNQEDINLFVSIQQNVIDEILLNARQDAITQWKSLVNFSMTGNLKTLEKSLIQNLDSSLLKRYGTTIVNTSIDTFYRTVNGTRAVNAGVDRFLYDGAPPEREFCVSHYKKVYTLDEINLMDNGQIGDVFFTGGGYNCRHFWRPVL